MKPYHYLSAVEQLAAHLREEIHRGQLSEMPGVDRLATILGSSQRTVLGALKLLESEDLLIKRGAGRAAKVNPESPTVRALLKIKIILYGQEEFESRFHIKILHHLEMAGHTASFASKTFENLGMDVDRVARYVNDTEADAWVLTAGPREVLEWFSGQPIPAFALFGRRRGLPIAGIGPDKEEAFKTVTRHLIGLGHRRIALLVRPVRRQPTPGLPERIFLGELEQAGIKTGTYNLPEWDGTSTGLHEILSALFLHTPPTALIVDEPHIFLAVQNFLARRGILAPDHVSLVSADKDIYFDAMHPMVSHISYESQPWARRIAKWANNVATGTDDRRQTLTKTEFVIGKTIGPPPLRSK